MKHVPSTGETTVFHYDVSGKLIAEYSSNVEPASTAQVGYTSEDHLGSPRIVTNRDGKVHSRRDFMPFGEELTATHTTERATYGGDQIRQKFTGYERDEELDLDFAQARNYSSVLGRFNSPDPFMPSAAVQSPDSWNRFTYARNNPLKYVDPNGLKAKPVFRAFSDLSEDEQRILNASSRTVKVKVNGKKVKKTLSGEALYNHMATKGRKKDNRRLANFLNQTAVLSAQKLSDGSSAISKVKSISKFQKDRIIAKVDPTLFVEIDKLSIKRKGRSELKGPEDSGALHGEFDTSFRQRFESAPQQISFSSRQSFEAADIDIDLCTGLCHVTEVVWNTAARQKTDAYKVYKRLTRRPKGAIKPNYEIVD